MKDEAWAVRRRYSKRAVVGGDARYSMLRNEVWKGAQERQRSMIGYLKKYTSNQLSEMRVLEVGCGGGGNLRSLIDLGFKPENLIGNELLEDRLLIAKKNLPASCTLIEGDACSLDIPDDSLDIVYQSLVFTSLLDDKFQMDLAAKMWRSVRPGGAVLWYDFIYNNPANPDVKGVSVRRIRELFPAGKIKVRRITLAPPISRRVCRIHSSFYDLFNLIPLLRTHVLCWIEK